MKVIVYSRPGCLQSKQLKRYLTKRGIPFIDKDITASKDNLLEYESYDYTDTPVIVVIDDDGREFVHEGFNEDVKIILDMLL